MADEGLPLSKWVGRKDSGKDWTVFAHSPSAPGLYRFSAEVRRRPHSLRTRCSTRGPDLAVRKPEVMSQGRASLTKDG